MSDQRRRRVPAVVDAGIALAVLGARAGMRVGGAAVSAIHPLTDAVDALCRDRWPGRCARHLTDLGAHHRQAALETVTRHYRVAVHHLVREAADSTVSETRQGIRTQAAKADRAVSRWFDHKPGRDVH
jgi:hypothetical protein